MRIVQRTALAAGTAVLVTLGIVVGRRAPRRPATTSPGPSASTSVYPERATTIASGLPFGIVGVSGGRVDTTTAARAEASHLTHSTLYVNTGSHVRRTRQAILAAPAASLRPTVRLLAAIRA